METENPVLTLAAETIHGLARQLIDLDFRSPLAFLLARRIGREIDFASNTAIKSQDEHLQHVS
jgi:hypothetical protein